MMEPRFTTIKLELANTLLKDWRARLAWIESCTLGQTNVAEMTDAEVLLHLVFWVAGYIGTPQKQAAA